MGVGERERERKREKERKRERESPVWNVTQKFPIGKFFPPSGWIDREPVHLWPIDRRARCLRWSNRGAGSSNRSTIPVGSHLVVVSTSGSGDQEARGSRDSEGRPPRYILSSASRGQRRGQRRRSEASGRKMEKRGSGGVGGSEKKKERQREAKTETEKSKEKERKTESEREAGRGLLFRLLESRLVSEAGGQSETCFHGRPGCWSTNPAASCREHATSRVVEHLLLASRVAPVFPSVETFYATFPTTPLLSFLLFVCLYVCPSVCPSVAAFIYASVARESLCFAREPCTPPASLSSFSLCAAPPPPLSTSVARLFLLVFPF